MEQLEIIKQMINNNQAEEAILLLDEFLEQNPSSDEAFFLRGKAYNKMGDIRNAMNNYLKAMELNPDSPAKQAYEMMLRIMNFFNKDMYNH